LNRLIADNYFYPGATIFGSDTFFSCAPKYHQAELGASELDVRINILPPKDSFKKLNDFLRNYDTLMTLLGGFISGRVIVTLLMYIVPKIKKHIRRRNQK
jgi:hypothetical protein